MYYRYEGLEILNKVRSPYALFKKLNVFLVRHGESVSNALRTKLKSENVFLDEDQVIEDAKIDLTEKGVAQSREIGKKLFDYLTTNGIDKDKTLVLVSPYQRARATYEYANESLHFDNDSDHVFVLNALREQAYGAFHMIDREIKKQKYGTIYENCQKNTISFFKPQFLGESPIDVSTRLNGVIDFIEKIFQQSDIETVVIFAHKNVNKCMLMNILNLPAEFYDDFDYDENCSVLNIYHGKFQKLKF